MHLLTTLLLSLCGAPRVISFAAHVQKALNQQVVSIQPFGDTPDHFLPVDTSCPDHTPAACLTVSADLEPSL